MSNTGSAISSVYNSVSRGLVTALGGIEMNMIIISQYIHFLFQYAVFRIWCLDFIFKEFATMLGMMPTNASDEGHVAYGGFGRRMFHGCIDPSQTGHFDGLVQERRNCSALAMELCLSCTNPSILDICQTSNITCTKSQNLNVSRLVSQSYVPNPLKSGVCYNYIWVLWVINNFITC